MLLPGAGASARKSRALKARLNFHPSSLQTPATPTAKACLQSETNTDKIIIKRKQKKY